MISINAPIVAIDEQVSSDLGGEAVILNLNSGIYYGLNEVGARIWELLQQPQTVLNLRDTITTEYETSPEACEHDILAVLHDLQAAKLIKVLD